MAVWSAAAALSGDNDHNAQYGRIGLCFFQVIIIVLENRINLPILSSQFHIVLVSLSVME